MAGAPIYIVVAERLAVRLVDELAIECLAQVDVLALVRPIVGGSDIPYASYQDQLDHTMVDVDAPIGAPQLDADPLEISGLCSDRCHEHVAHVRGARHAVSVLSDRYEAGLWPFARKETYHDGHASFCCQWLLRASPGGVEPHGDASILCPQPVVGRYL